MVYHMGRGECSLSRSRHVVAVSRREEWMVGLSSVTSLHVGIPYAASHEYLSHAQTKEQNQKSNANGTMMIRRSLFHVST